MPPITEPKAPASPDDLAASLVKELIPNHTFVEGHPETTVTAEQLFDWCRGRVEAWLKQSAVKAASGYSFGDARRTTFRWLVNETMQHLLYRQLLPTNNPRYTARSLAGRVLEAQNSTEVTIANPRSPLFASGNMRKTPAGDATSSFTKAQGSWGNKDNAILQAVSGATRLEDISDHRASALLQEAFPELAEKHPGKLNIKHGEWRETAWDVLDHAMLPESGGDMYLDEPQRERLFEATIDAINAELGPDKFSDISSTIPDEVAVHYLNHQNREYLKVAEEEEVADFCRQYEVQHDAADRPGTIDRLMVAVNNTAEGFDKSSLVLPTEGGECALYTRVLTHAVMPILTARSTEASREVVERTLPLIAFYAVIITSEIGELRKDRARKQAAFAQRAALEEAPAAPRPDAQELERIAKARDALNAFFLALSKLRSIDGFNPKAYPIIVLLKFLEMSVTRFNREEYMDLRMSL